MEMGTIFITKSEVPTFLRSGEFYRSLSDDEDCEQHISIPSNALKADVNVTNNEELHHLLSSLRFWGVNTIQDEVIKYCLSELESPFNDILLEFAQDFPYVSALASVLSASKDHKVMVAILSGILEIVRNLPENITMDVDCCRSAAKTGNLEILQCMHERGGVLDSSVLDAALEGGDKSFACVQYLCAQGVEWPSDSLVTALKAGSKECFQYALEDGCTWDNHGYSTFCEDQYVEALKYAMEHGYPVSYPIATECATNGAIKCLQLLHEVNCPWDEETCTEAATNGHLDCLQYLHEHGCPWDEETVYRAVGGNHIGCVQYALQQGCPVSSGSCYAAAKNGYFSILVCLHESGCPWDANACAEAACNGHLKCLQYAHEHGAPWDENTFRRTLESGELECLMYLVENRCPISGKDFQEYAKRGRCSQQAVEIVRSFHPDVM